MKTIYILLAVFTFIFMIKEVNAQNEKIEYLKENTNLIFSQMNKSDNLDENRKFNYPNFNAL